MSVTKDWSARQYLKFEDERTRPARDLLAQVPLQEVHRAVDLGCGPGNSTELLVTRYPEAKVSGIDSSQDMLRQARERLPNCEFTYGDLAAWIPDEPADLLFANAVYQWVPNHLHAIRRVIEAMPEGGVFAAQMPDNTREPSHVVMEEVGAKYSGTGAAARGDLPAPAEYYDALKPLCRSLEIWHTIYNHSMGGPGAIAEWFKGSALRPYLASMNAETSREFLADYVRGIAPYYPVQTDGQVLLRFPRLFIVATR